VNADPVMTVNFKSKTNIKKKNISKRDPKTAKFYADFKFGGKVHKCLPKRL
jgi:hypothetical protein